MTWPLVVMAAMAAVGPVLGYRIGLFIAEKRASQICARAMAKCLQLDHEDNVEGAVWAIAEIWSDATDSPVQWLAAARESVGYLPLKPTIPGDHP